MASTPMRFPMPERRPIRINPFSRTEECPMSRPTLSRRHFLQGTIAGGAALSLAGRTTWALDVTGQPQAGPIGDFKISLAEWSLHKALFGKQLTNLDFPRVAREDYGIEAVEYVNQFFKDKAHDEGYLKDLRKRASDS